MNEIAIDRDCRWFASKEIIYGGRSQLGVLRGVLVNQSSGDNPPFKGLVEELGSLLRYQTYSPEQWSTSALILPDGIRMQFPAISFLSPNDAPCHYRSCIGALVRIERNGSRPDGF